MSLEGYAENCRNCGKRIIWTGYSWCHRDDRHTVCEWREGMDPTDRVATPKEWNR